MLIFRRYLNYEDCKKELIIKSDDIVESIQKSLVQDIDLFDNNTSGKDYNFFVSKKITESEEDRVFEIYNETKSVSILVTDNTIIASGTKCRIILDKIVSILKRLSSNEDELWLYETKFPVGGIVDVIKKHNMKSYNNIVWSGLFNLIELERLVLELKYFFKY